MHTIIPLVSATTGHLCKVCAVPMLCNPRDEPERLVCDIVLATWCLTKNEDL